MQAAGSTRQEQFERVAHHATSSVPRTSLELSLISVTLAEPRAGHRLAYSLLQWHPRCMGADVGTHVALPLAERPSMLPSSQGRLDSGLYAHMCTFGRDGKQGSRSSLAKTIKLNAGRVCCSHASPTSLQPTGSELRPRSESLPFDAAVVLPRPVHNSAFHMMGASVVSCAPGHHLSVCCHARGRIAIIAWAYVRRCKGHGNCQLTQNLQ